jgi:hypothetical protein
VQYRLAKPPVMPSAERTRPAPLTELTRPAAPTRVLEPARAPRQLSLQFQFHR